MLTQFVVVLLRIARNCDSKFSKTCHTHTRARGDTDCNEKKNNNNNN